MLASLAAALALPELLVLALSQRAPRLMKNSRSGTAGGAGPA
jgi:hypothetical protein